MSEPAFFGEQERVYLRSQLGEAVAGERRGAQGDAGGFRALPDETRSIAYVTLTDQIVGDVADPDAATLQAFYEERKGEFRRPEFRKFTYLALTPEDLAAKIVRFGRRCQGRVREPEGALYDAGKAHGPADRLPERGRRQGGGRPHRGRPGDLRCHRRGAQGDAGRSRSRHRHEGAASRPGGRRGGLQAPGGRRLRRGPGPAVDVDPAGLEDRAVRGDLVRRRQGPDQEGRRAGACPPRPQRPPGQDRGRACRRRLA